jgi:hypothetical protein
MQHKRNYKYRGYAVDIFIDDEANVNVDVLGEDGELVDGAFKNTTQAEEYINELVFQSEGILITGGSQYGYTYIRLTKEGFDKFSTNEQVIPLILKKNSNAVYFLGNDQETKTITELLNIEAGTLYSDYFKVYYRDETN